MLARSRIIADINANGLTVSDYSGLNVRTGANDLTMTQAPECLSGADLILVCVKSGASAEMAGLISRHAPRSTPVISLQNGFEGCETLRMALTGRDVRAAMVPFNVVPVGPGQYHRASSGGIVIEAGPGALMDILSVPGLAVTQSSDIAEFQWGKLLVNLNNALNALSGLTLRDMLMSRDWRRLMADQMQEALGVLKAAGIKSTSNTSLPNVLIPYVLRLPTWAFARIAAQMLTVDPTARMSMAYDLMQNRKTEIDSFQGLIIALGRKHGMATPCCNRALQAIRAAEKIGQGSPVLSPSALR